jgi:hypothetical protein
MGFIKLTGQFLNSELNSFFRDFGYTQIIERQISEYPDLTTANQFTAPYLRYYKRAAINRNPPISAIDIQNYDPLKRVNLYDIWTTYQNTPLDKLKFYLLDNKLLFFWIPRTSQGYHFRSNSRWRQADFGKSVGGWFCLHRSTTPDEEGNFPLKFGLPVEYNIYGIVSTPFSTGQYGDQRMFGNDIAFSEYGVVDFLLKTQEFANMEPFKGIAYNWDFQGGIIYRNYGAIVGDAIRQNRDRIKDNMDWYGALKDRLVTSQLRQGNFSYPSVRRVAYNPRQRSSRGNLKRMSTIDSNLKRIKGVENIIPGREFRASCTTEKDLKSLMNRLESEEPFKVVYSIPKAGNKSESIFSPRTLRTTLIEAGLNSSLSVAGVSNRSNRTHEIIVSEAGQFEPLGFYTEITLDSENCGPIFAGRTPKQWLQQRTPVTGEESFIINYNYRYPQILR